MLQKFGIVTILLLVVNGFSRSYDSTRVFDSVQIEQQIRLEPRNPLLSGALSTVVPGAGQIYNRRYVKAGAFLVLEVTSGLITRYWYRESQSRFEYARNNSYDDLNDYPSEHEKMLINQEYQAQLCYNGWIGRYSMYTALSWMVGGYIYNIYDAIGGSHYFDNDDEKNTLVAGLLSAVPALGLGQLYNGSISRAGMISMVQVSLGVKVANEYRLMKKAQDKYAKSLTIKNDDGVAFVTDAFGENWESRRETARRNWNMYLWYALAFYFYGIFDAVVDAHLHDYPKKIRAYPDLIPELHAFKCNFEYFF